MFTGIVTDMGTVRAIARDGDTRFEIQTHYDMKTVDIGASISHSGVCLTVIETGPGWFAVQASAETLSKSTLAGWQVGVRINLERALKVGDELGGHIVSGHVDGVGEVVSVRDDGESKRFVFRVPAALKNFMAPKGSVAVDGVSLTVNEVEGDTFGVNIIPHTQQVTLFGGYAPGTKVNLEIDMLARYVARLLERE
ncbi:riboflavin synthase [Oleispirillum naphthae]|uniref:riboflavin synthase n=1 Tax=Oleispirillum naphthae TaxID=2838853 RepID=UPI0030826ABF